MIIVQKHSVLLAIIIGSLLYSCTAGRHTAEGPAHQSEKSGHKTFLSIKAILENGEDIIDYDTLMNVYNSVAQSQHRIPHMDELLTLLIKKRNSNPRIDQMILIFTSKIIGSSKFQIPNIYELFESILNMEDSRLNKWVISFVAASIGKYPFDIPKGDVLVDLLEQRLDQAILSSTKDAKEFFGFHFMPPPRSTYIKLYIGGINERRTRERERNFYYSLKQNNISDLDIEMALKRIQKDCVPRPGQKRIAPLEYLLINVDSIFSGMENEKR